MAANQQTINLLTVMWEYGRTTGVNVSEQSAFAACTSTDCF